jgi:hypothetical protein
MPNRIEARSAKAALTNATGRLPLLRLFSTPLIYPDGILSDNAWRDCSAKQAEAPTLTAQQRRPD